MYLSQIFYYCISRSTSAAVKRLYVQRQLLSLRYAEGYTTAANQRKIAPCRNMFSLRDRRLTPVALYFTDISYAVVTQIAARATALRSPRTA